MAELIDDCASLRRSGVRARARGIALPAWSQMLRFGATVVARPAGRGGARQPPARPRAPRNRCCCRSRATARRAGAEFRPRAGRGRPHRAAAADRGAVRGAEGRRRRRRPRRRSTAAFALTDAQLAELKAALEKRFGKKIEATVNVNPTLIGGARVTVGDAVIDGSVQAQARTRWRRSLRPDELHAPASQPDDARTSCS